MDGSGVIDSLLTSGVKGSPRQVDLKKGINLITDPELWLQSTKCQWLMLKNLFNIIRMNIRKLKRMDIKKKL